MPTETMNSGRDEGELPRGRGTRVGGPGHVGDSRATSGPRVSSGKFPGRNLMLDSQKTPETWCRRTRVLRATPGHGSFTINTSALAIGTASSPPSPGSLVREGGWGAHGLSVHVGPPGQLDLTTEGCGDEGTKAAKAQNNDFPPETSVLSPVSKRVGGH